MFTQNVWEGRSNRDFGCCCLAPHVYLPPRKNDVMWMLANPTVVWQTSDTHVQQSVFNSKPTVRVQKPFWPNRKAIYSRILWFLESMIWLNCRILRVVLDDGCTSDHVWFTPRSQESLLLPSSGCVGRAAGPLLPKVGPSLRSSLPSLEAQQPSR